MSVDERSGRAVRARDAARPWRLRVAAAGDVHASAAVADRLSAALREVAAKVDLVLLAGDLTTHGDPAQAEVLAAACAPLSTPVVAVLGNHDWHAGRHEEIAATLEAAGVTVLQRAATVVEAGGVEVGIAGTKGFVGGFPDSRLTDFGEPLLRRLYAETSGEVEALRAGLRAIAGCTVRIVLLHYAPVIQTLHGEPVGIRTYLGSDRLAGPIAAAAPDLVLHGHAHHGRFRGAIDGVPVRNVAVPVLGRPFALLELAPAGRDGGVRVRTVEGVVG